MLFDLRNALYGVTDSGPLDSLVIPHSLSPGHAKLRLYFYDGKKAREVSVHLGRFLITPGGYSDKALGDCNLHPNDADKAGILGIVSGLFLIND